MWDYCADHGAECPTVAIARLSVTCKAAGLMRSPAEVQVHVRARKMRQDQFADAAVDDDYFVAGEMDDYHRLCAGEGYDDFD